MVHNFPKLGGMHYGTNLHGSATTTEAIRRAIQNSQESLRASKRYGINQKTVAKWKKRTSVADLATGPKEPKSTVLSPEEEAVIVAFRKHLRLDPPKTVLDTRERNPPQSRVRDCRTWSRASLPPNDWTTGCYWVPKSA